MSVEGLIFDFDGVILLSEPVHQRAWVDLAREMEKELPEGFLERGIGHSDIKLSEELAEFWGNGAVAGYLLSTKRNRYQRRALAETVFVPGIQPALEFFAEKFPLALATSSSREDIAPHMEGFALNRHFQAVLTIESVVNPKPDPEIYLKAAECLNLRPDQCLVFEDSVHGAAAARAAGMKLIGMTTTHPADSLAPVEAHFRDYLDLEAIYKLILGS